MYNLNWEKTKEGTARLLGVTDMPGELVLPKQIAGLPLTEVGPYCFAKNKYLERVVLPDTITKIDRMAFYNCTGLKELELGANLTELGGDAFMNCHNLHQIKVRCGAKEASGVRFVLRQISSDLTVHFLGETVDESAVILFSDYYESYDEVTPAHLFGRNIEGEGFRARQCFKEGIFEYVRYDDTVFFYDRYAGHHMLEQAAKERRLSPKIERLVSLDRQGNTDHLRVLHAFLQWERRPTQTAAFLHMHRNNVIYRIDRLKTLLDISLEDPAVRMELECSLLVLELISPEDIQQNAQ